jgi:chromosome segregation ATPase
LEWSRVIVLEKEVQGIEERVTNIGEQLKSLKKAKAEAEVDFAKCQEQLEPKLKESAANQEQMQALTNELSQLEANKYAIYFTRK